MHRYLRLTAWIVLITFTPFPLVSFAHYGDGTFHATHCSECGGAAHMNPADCIDNSGSDDYDIGQSANKLGQGAALTYGGVAATLAGGAMGIWGKTKPLGFGIMMGGVAAIGRGIGMFVEGWNEIRNNP